MYSVIIDGDVYMKKLEWTVTKSRQITGPFYVTKAGLYLDFDLPFIGASPDGMVSCKTCGRGVIEVKSSFHVRDGLSEDELQDIESLCMEKIEGELNGY